MSTGISLLLFSSLFLSLPFFLHGAGPTQSYDCGMKMLALEYASLIQPFRTDTELQSIADALNGSPQYGNYNCNVSVTQLSRNTSSSSSFVFPSYSAPLRIPFSPSFTSTDNGMYIVLIVDPVHGNDQQAIRTPESTAFRTIQAAVDHYARTKNDKLSSSSSSSSSLLFTKGIIYLRGTGTHYLTRTIQLDTIHQGLSFQSYPNEQATISGGIPLRNLQWTSTNITNNKNIWQTSLASVLNPLNTNYVPGLRYNHTRLIRARYPNANPEEGFGSTITPNWMVPEPFTPPTTWNPSEPFRNDTVNTVAQTFSMGYNITPGDPCSFYEPPGGYFCGDHTTFGGYNGMPQWPKGINVSTSLLPNTPYWTNISNSAVVHGFRGNHWFSRMHIIDSYDPTNLAEQIFLFDYGRGGFQGAEGTTEDAEFYIENVYEELDAPGEWFYNSSTQILYLWWNATSGTLPPSGTTDPSDTLIATQLDVFFNSTSNQTNPIMDLGWYGILFEDQSITYFHKHLLPSGGDWAIQRTGAIYFEGVKNITITNCTFNRMDGIGIFLGGYTRNVTISYNTFSWNGETIIALLGDGDYPSDAPLGLPARMGPDLTAGNQPRYTTIEYNIAHEIGIWQKQSSFIFQGVAGLSTIRSNIYYNGPRAAINFNDGSLGGSLMQGNLGFNFCRESGDHGIFNSWDRLPYLQDVQGYPSTTKLWDTHRNNFYIANYQSMAAIDTDDVSGYHALEGNFFSYAPFFLKSDFGGHDQRGIGNVIGYLAETSWFDGPAALWDTWGFQNPGHELHLTDNIISQGWCQNGPWPGAAYTCESNWTIGLTCYGADTAITVTGNNTYYLPMENTSIPVYECGILLQDYQNLCSTCDPGSKALPFPEDDVLLNAARTVLGMPPSSRDG